MAHQHPESELKALKIRIRKVVGQLGAVERMLGEDRDCPEVLMQLVSARRAIKSLSEQLIDRHLHHCIEGAQQRQGKKKLRELLDVLNRYVE